MQMAGILMSADSPRDHPDILLDMYQAGANMFSMIT